MNSPNKGRKRRYSSSSDLTLPNKMANNDENVNSEEQHVFSASTDEVNLSDTMRNYMELNSDRLTVGSSDDDMVGTAAHYQGIGMEKANMRGDELHSSQIATTSKTTTSKSTQRVCFYVEATYSEHSSSKYELTNLICQPIAEQTAKRDSLSSGYLADGSKSGSPTSSTSVNQLPPHLARMSYCSTASSGSNIPISAAALVTQTRKKSCVHKETINKLKKKWKNSELVYSLLERLDQLLGDGQILHNVSNTPMRTRKRLGSNDKDIRKVKLSPPLPALIENKGQKVFAKWRNRKYYFGYISETLNDNRLKIVYLDKSSNIVNQNNTITDFTSLIGNTVMVSKDGQQYYPGIITSFDVTCFKYMAATNNGDFPVDVGNIYFTETQAKSILTNQPNVPLITNSFCDELSPSCSGTQLLNADINVSTSADSANSKSCEESDHVHGCDRETKQPQNLSNSLKLKNLQGKVPKRINKNEDLLLGPLDVQGEWFKGCNFLITCSVGTPAGKISETVPAESEYFQFTTTPFILDRLVQQIKLGSGRVVQTLEDVEPCEYKKTYLITNRPCLTPKYLKCLAFGIKILCHQWIVSCTLRQELLPLEELPAGWSIEKSCFVNMIDRKSSLPLSDLIIRIAQYDNPNFSKFWVHICNALGATTTTFVGTFENTDLIVVEDGMECEKLTAAYSVGVPLVSSSWLVQTIIHGEARSYTAHPSYSYLHEEPSN